MPNFDGTLFRHEFLGRGFGVGSVELFTHNLNSVEFSDQFKPDGSPSHMSGEHGNITHFTFTTAQGVLTRTITTAVTIGAGVEWGTLYQLADQNNRSIAGGFSPLGSVGAGGGWILGGGHSVLSHYYGLGNITLPNIFLPTLTA